MTTFFFSTSGRLNRAKLWLGSFGIAGLFLAGIVAGAALIMIAQSIDGGKNSTALFVGIALGALVILATLGLTFASGLCLGIRRYHDRDKPGAWVLIQFVPMVGPVWYFIEAFCLPGTYGANQYGADPLNPGVGSVQAAIEARIAAGRRPSPARPGWIVPVLLIPAAFAVITALAGAAWAVHEKSWLDAATKVEGKVVELVPAGKTSDGSHETFKAVYEGQTSDGAPIRITDSVATYPAPTVGSTASLAYPAGKPEEAVVATSQYFGPMIVGGMGAFYTLFWLYVALLVKLLWKRRPQVTAPIQPHLKAVA